MRRLFIFLFFLFFLLSNPLSTQAQTPGCGTYNTFADQCRDSDFEPIQPFVVCSGSGQDCCSTQELCPGDPQPQPNYTQSSENCGTRRTPPGSSQSYCFEIGSTTKIISNAVDCSVQTGPYCCRSISYCNQSWSCDPQTGNCVADSSGSYNDLPACEANCTNPDDSNLQAICDSLEPNSDLWNKCDECYRRYGNRGLWTAFGCFNTFNTASLITSFVRLAVGLAGGLALLLILTGAFIYSTSTGNPERTKLAQEIITAAISGLVFIILSIAILQFIGVELLRIPGFGS